MKIIEYVRLRECAICTYSIKKKDGKLKCDWYDKGKNLISCEKVKECGNFPDIENIKVNLSNMKI